MKEEILHILTKNKSNFTSGENLSHLLGVSRTAIWKHIKQLKEEGYNIESISKKGYRLLSSPDLLTYSQLYPYLKTNFIGENYLHFQSLDSTNTKGKELWQSLVHGTVIVSEYQDGGKGRLGRLWSCEKSKGILCSIILKPDIETKDIAKITSVTAAAIYNTLNEFGIPVKIKWPNDILLNNKKLCGILTEMSGDMDNINYLIIGIGLNVNLEKQDFPEFIYDIATSLKVEYNRNFSRPELLGSLLNNFELLWNDFIKGNFLNSIKICRENSCVLGKDVSLLFRGEQELVKVLDLTDDGELLVIDKNNHEKIIYSGEISLR